MKMIGIPSRPAAIRSCNSSPLRSGRLTSRTRQLGPRVWERARKSSEDANVSGRQPACRINASRDSRTETSSSTTKTTGTMADIGGVLTGWRATLATIIYVHRNVLGHTDLIRRCAAGWTGVHYTLVSTSLSVAVAFVPLASACCTEVAFGAAGWADVRSLPLT